MTYYSSPRFMPPLLRSGTRPGRTAFRAALLVVVFTACGYDAGARSHTVTDSAGVEVVTSTRPVWGDSAVWSIAQEPSLRIGHVSGDSRHELYDVRGARQLPDGRVVVADGGPRLRFYGPDGRWIRDAGREGGGPGEFRRITRMLVYGDTIWVHDRGLDRVSVFNDRGEFVRGIRMEQWSDGLLPALAGRLADGRLVLAQTVAPFWADPEPGVWSQRVRYLLAGPGGTIRRELGTFEGHMGLVKVENGSVSEWSLLWARDPYMATTRSGFLYGSGEAYRIQEYDDEGRLRRIIRLDRAPVSVGAAQYEAWADTAIARSGNPAAVRVALREHYDGVDLPDTKPTWVELRIGGHGDLWLKAYSSGLDATERWTVFDSAGVWLGELTMPPRFELHQVGEDFVLGIATDTMDVERVALYRLDRGRN